MLYLEFGSDHTSSMIFQGICELAHFTGRGETGTGRGETGRGIERNRCRWGTKPTVHLPHHKANERISQTGRQIIQRAE